jgi:voltage-gated potassium channel Kch
VFPLIATARDVVTAIWRVFVDTKTRGLLVLTAGLIGIGTVFYRIVESLSWSDSFYFTIVTLTTTGFGDISPETRVGKLFTAFYLLVGIGILLGVATEIANRAMDVRLEQREGRIARRERRHADDDEGD